MLLFAQNLYIYSLKQSDRNSSKTDTSYKPTMYKQHVLNKFCAKINFCQTQIQTNRSFQNKDETISSEVIASRKVSIFKLFPSDCITLYVIYTQFVAISLNGLTNQSGFLKGNNCRQKYSIITYELCPIKQQNQGHVNVYVSLVLFSSFFRPKQSVIVLAKKRVFTT